MALSDFERACELVDYQLTFTRSLVRREFHLEGLSGPDLPDATGQTGTAPGSWDVPHWAAAAEDSLDDVPLWLHELFSVAAAEVLHELMEWFHVDGRPYINPHGPHAQQLIAECQDFARRLAARYATDPPCLPGLADPPGPADRPDLDRERETRAVPLAAGPADGRAARQAGGGGAAATGPPSAAVGGPRDPLATPVRQRSSG